MSKNDLRSCLTDDVTCTALGHNFYLFRGNDGNTDQLLISSHGGATKRKVLIPGGTTLYFYCPHGMSLTDPGVTPIALGEIKSWKCRSKSVYDYPLSKYQEKYGTKNKETYGTIVKALKNNRIWCENAESTVNAILDEIVKKKILITNPEDVSMAERALEKILIDVNPDVEAERLWKSKAITLITFLTQKKELKPMDILTVRKRAFHSNPKLSDVFKELERNDLKYRDVHCSFCRPEKGPDLAYEAPKVKAREDRARKNVDDIVRIARKKTLIQRTLIQRRVIPGRRYSL